MGDGQIRREQPAAITCEWPAWAQAGTSSSHEVTLDGEVSDLTWCYLPTSSLGR